LFEKVQGTILFKVPPQERICDGKSWTKARGAARGRKRQRPKKGMDERKGEIATCAVGVLLRRKSLEQAATSTQPKAKEKT